MKTGDALEGRYRLEQRIGQGGMGQVWRARDLRLGREVAVKVLRTDQGEEADEQTLARFRREGMAAALMNHPHIATVHDIGKHQESPFLVMELLPGPDLATLLKGRSGGLPVEQVLEYGAQVAEALAAAHAEGVIHRDIKPSNLLLDRHGRVKICDFGIARFRDGTGGVSAPGAVLGTAAYMAPEQGNGEVVDSAADVYALGATLFHLLTGTVVFPGGSWREVVSRLLTQPPPAPSSLRPGIPQALDTYLLTLLAKSPSARPSADSIAARLRAPSSGGKDERTAVRRATRVIVLGKGRSSAAAFSPDCRTLATGSENGSIFLWDAVTGAATATLTGPHLGQVSDMAFSRNGKILAVGHNSNWKHGGARLWDTATGTAIATFVTPTNLPVASVAFSPGGEILATAHNPDPAKTACVHLWDVATGEIISRYRDDSWTGGVSMVAFGPDGHTLVIRGFRSGAQPLHLWDVRTGRVRDLEDAHGAVAFSPGGEILATGTKRIFGKDGVVRLWDVATGEAIATLAISDLNSYRTNSVGAFSPDGQTLAMGTGLMGRGGVEIWLWDVAARAFAATLTNPGLANSSSIDALAFGPDGQTLASAHRISASTGDSTAAVLWQL